MVMQTPLLKWDGGGGGGGEGGGDFGFADWVCELTVTLAAPAIFLFQ